MDKAPTPSKCDLDSILDKMNKLESKVNELEKRTIKIERTRLNLIPKTTLSKEQLFEKDIAVSDNVKAVIIGINFTNTSTTGSGLGQNLNFQIYQKGADQYSYSTFSLSDPHVYCNQNYSEIITPWDVKKEKKICIKYDRSWGDTSPYIIVDLVGFILY